MACPDRILHLYERGMAGCRSGRAEVVGEVVAELITALDFEHEAAALVVFRLYEYCGRQARAGRFERALGVFGELHHAWVHGRHHLAAGRRG
jgi:hypothetical protein